MWGWVSVHSCSAPRSKHAKVHLTQRARDVLLLNVPKGTENAQSFTETIRFLRKEEWH